MFGALMAIMGIGSGLFSLFGDSSEEKRREEMEEQEREERAKEARDKSAVQEVSNYNEKLKRYWGLHDFDAISGITVTSAVKPPDAAALNDERTLMGDGYRNITTDDRGYILQGGGMLGVTTQGVSGARAVITQPPATIGDMAASAVSASVSTVEQGYQLKTAYARYKSSVK